MKTLPSPAALLIAILSAGQALGQPPEQAPPVWETSPVKVVSYKLPANKTPPVCLTCGYSCPCGPNCPCDDKQVTTPVTFTQNVTTYGTPDVQIPYETRRMMTYQTPAVSYTWPSDHTVTQMRYGSVSLTTPQYTYTSVPQYQRTYQVVSPAVQTVQPTRYSSPTTQYQSNCGPNGCTPLTGLPTYSTGSSCANGQCGTPRGGVFRRR